MKRAGMCLILLSLLLCAFCPGCSPQVGVTEEDRAVVDQVIHDCTGWALTKDRARLESIIAHDAEFFMFQPRGDDTIVGWDAFVELFDFWMDPRFKATHFELHGLRINFSRSGDVAWFSTILDDYGEWEGRSTSWEDTRWTGVLEKRDGTWVIVQMHFSFASKQVREEVLAETAD